MTGFFETTPDRLPDIFSTKMTPQAVVFSATISPGTNSANITLAAAGEYEVVGYHASGAASFSGVISIQVSGGGSNLWYFGLKPGSYFTRRVNITQNNLAIQLSNGFAASIGAIIQKVNKT